MIPRLSVIMSAYNADATMSRSVASVLSQSHGDFELIIVDDGSRDGSAGLARLLAIEDRRIRTVRKTHGGTASAFNRGIDAAAGEYLAFTTAGEVWARTRFTRHLAIMEQSPECGVILEPGDEAAGICAHRAVLAEAGPFNADLGSGAEREWVARVQNLTDWQIHTLAADARRGTCVGAGGMPAAASLPASVVAPRVRAQRFGGFAAFLIGQKTGQKMGQNRQILAG